MSGTMKSDPFPSSHVMMIAVLLRPDIQGEADQGGQVRLAQLSPFWIRCEMVVLGTRCMSCTLFGMMRLNLADSWSAGVALKGRESLGRRLRLGRRVVAERRVVLDEVPGTVESAVGGHRLGPFDGAGARGRVPG